jgi:hypothetical protein
MIMESRDDVIDSAYGNLLPTLRRLSPRQPVELTVEPHLRPWNVISARASTPRALRGRGWTVDAGGHSCCK